MTRKTIVRARVLALTFLPVAFLVALPPCLQAQEPAPQRTVVLEDASQMKYFKGRVNPPANWTALDFDDGAWLDGHIPCGYGEPFIIAPVWTVFTDMKDGYVTMYARLPFELPSPEKVTELRIEAARYDDGFVAYVNGVEVVKASMPAGILNKDTLAISHEYSDATITRRLNTPELLDALEAGTNIFAVEMHNTSLGSSDVVFQTKLSAFIIPDVIPEFIRGAECDGQAALDIGDPIYLLRWKLGGFYGEPDCPKACDANDDGTVDMSDAVFALQYLFLGGPPFPLPYPAAGPDPTDDELTCASD